MDFKPQTFFIGVMDFFSVILPGALLTYFLSGMYYGDIFGDGKMFREPSSESAKWAMFFFRQLYRR